MTTTQRSVIVGLFEDHTKAEQAVQDLQRVGFHHDQIAFAGHQASTGGRLLASLKSLFTGEDSTSDHVYDELVGIGIPSDDARSYQREYEAGHNLVAVSDADTSKLQEARTILARYGASGANRPAAASPDAAGAARASQQSVADAQGEQRLHLREEQLHIYKRPVQAGEVQLHKEVVTEQQTLDVPLTHEEVYIERRPASGPLRDPTPIGESESIRIPVHEEQVDVNKQTVVREEVEVGKRSVQETQQVRETVRREEAQIEREGDAPVHDTRSDPFHPSTKDVQDLLDE